MKLTVLGSGVCAVTRERSCAAYLLQVNGLNILLDIGFGTMRRLTEAGVFYGDIDAVLISHLHLDHVGDLAPLIMALRYTPGLERRKPLTLIGPKHLPDFLRGCRDLLGDWLLEDGSFPLAVHALSEEPLTFGGGSIRAFSMKHAQFSNGYRIRFNGKVLAYSGDTGWCPELIELCCEADLALIECSYDDGPRFEYHLTPAEAGEAAKQAGAKRLVLTHFYPPLDVQQRVEAAAAVFSGTVTAAEDFQTLTI